MKSKIFYDLAHGVAVFEYYQRWFFNKSRKFSSTFFFVGMIFTLLYYWDAYGKMSPQERMTQFYSSAVLKLDTNSPIFTMQILIICLFFWHVLDFLLKFLTPRLRCFLISLSDSPYLYAKSLFDLTGCGVEYGHKPFMSIFGHFADMPHGKNEGVLKSLNELCRRIDGFLVQKVLGIRTKKRLMKSIAEFKKIDLSDERYGFSRYLIALILLRGLKSKDIDSIRKYLEIAANLRIPKSKFELGLLLVSQPDVKDQSQALSLFDQAIKEMPPENMMCRARFESAILLKALGSIEDLKLALTHLDNILKSRGEVLATNGGLNIHGIQDLHSSRTGNFHNKVEHLRGEVQELLDVNIRAENELNIQRARQEESRQMISFLSHTLTSATTGLSSSVRKIASKLAKSQVSGSYPAETVRLAEKLASQVSRMSRVESLVEVFKLYTSDPNTLREGWARDSGGDVTVLQVAAMAIQQALLRFYFASEHESDFSRLMSGVEYSTSAQEFMQDVLALDMTEQNNTLRFIEWMRLRLPFLSLDYEGAESVHVGQGGARDIVIYSLVSEFLGNALKYAAAGEPITLEIGIKGEFLVIACSNVMNPDATPSIHSGKSGLTFVRHVCNLIDAEFEEPVTRENFFNIGVRLPIRSLAALNVQS